MMHWQRLALAALLVAAAASPADDWPQWMGPRRDGAWRETGIVEKFPPGGPKLLWRTPVGGGYAGPAVAGGRVYVTDLLTDADTRKLSSPSERPKVTGNERVLCLDAATGKQLWKHDYAVTYDISYPGGPRCTPTVHDGKVYTLGAVGDLRCLDAAEGKLLWSKSFGKDYAAKTPIWGFASHPLIDGKKLICVVGGKNALAVAFDKDSGKELWRSLDASEPGYAPPTLITAGGKRQLLLWDPEAIHSLDPETGKQYWSVPLVPSYGMAIMAPRQSGDHLFAGGIGGKAVLVRLDREKPAAEEVWRGKRDTAVYPINSTPWLDEDTIFGVDQRGELRAVDLASGKRLWQTTRPTTGAAPENSGTAFLIKNGERFFLFNEKGELIIARLTRDGYEEIDRARLLAPTATTFGRDVVWSHPAFAGKCVFARNDREIVCYSLAK